MNDLKRLRAACKARLRDIEIPRPFDLDEFARNVQAHRNRPLLILPAPDPTSDDMPYGSWWATDHGDFIFYEPHTTELHRTQIVLHELAHMLWGDEAAGVADSPAANTGLPDIEPAAIRTMMTRHNYSTPEERRAELLASLILEETGMAPAPAAEDGLAARLSDVLGNPRRKRSLR
ncbi:hypothetical protein [Catenulispora rubra]|uniref:hypothetical protein n=1 Tax=Catenulispora rubra TaxID=280293 RepID=UPI001892012E|nr:hypothetical protein [Catenulispora rubra]